MNYAAQSQRLNPAAIVGAVGIPAAFGLLLVTGLAVTVAVTQDENPEGFLITPEPTTIPPPPPEPTEVKETQQASSTVTAPANPFDFNDSPVAPSTPLPDTPLPPGPLPGSGNNTGEEVGPSLPPPPPPPPPAPKFDPVAAKPVGNPGTWVRNSDYRSNWIRREMTGVAGFTLQISASGRVTGCSITSSTGHSALDQATCRLVQRRARFQPARNSNGDKVAGTFSASVTWQLPE